MSQEKIDSGTIILDQKGIEIGVIKKVYSQTLVRLELTNADSIALDPKLLSEITITGKLLKKKTAIISPEANIFFKGANETLNKTFNKALVVIIDHLISKEVRKALQHFEFDFLNSAEIQEKLPNLELLGFIKGIELSGKNPQDFIIKIIFQLYDSTPMLKEKIAPEILVDLLNQEKAFLRIIWNVLRLAIAQAAKAKDLEIIDASIEAIIELALKNIEIEMKIEGNSNEILYWQNRIEDCVAKYIALMLLQLDVETQNNYLNQKKNKMIEQINEMKINSTIKDYSMKILEDFTVKTYSETKNVELIHSGIKGFNLKVMTEKKALKDLQDLVNDFFKGEEKSKKIVNLQKKIDEFSRETRDVSKDFLNILFDISQYLKKIEYGDSKIHDFYIALSNKIDRKKYNELNQILDKIGREFIKSK